MRFFQRFGILLIVVLMGASYWSAQRFNEQIAPRSELEKLELAMELLELTGATARYEKVLADFSEAYFDNEYYANSGLEFEDLQRLRKLMAEEMGENLSDLLYRVAFIYAEEMSAEELEALVAFYKSAPGQKMIEKRSLIETQQTALGAYWSERQAPFAADRAIRRIKAEGVPIEPQGRPQDAGVFAACFKPLKNAEDAVNACTDLIQLGVPDDPIPYIYRGVAHIALLQKPEADADFASAQSRVETPDLFFFQRGTIYMFGDQSMRAIQNFDQAIELNPKSENAYLNRGFTYQNMAQYRKALQDYERAIEANPKAAMSYNNKAWLLATCWDDSIRDGVGAVEAGLKAVSLEPTSWLSHSTLAAAYAEKGEFGNAVATQKRAIELLGNGGGSQTMRIFRARLRLYEDGQAHRVK